MSPLPRDSISSFPFCFMMKLYPDVKIKNGPCHTYLERAVISVHGYAYCAEHFPFIPSLHTLTHRLPIETG